MDSVLALLLIPLLLAGLILVILNMLDVDISLINNNDSTKLDEHSASEVHTKMLNVDHNSSIGAHTNFDDKYMSSSSVKALIDENNTSSSNKELIGSLVTSSMSSTLSSSLDTHNTSSTAHNLNNYSDLGTKLRDLEIDFNTHLHAGNTSAIESIHESYEFNSEDMKQKYNWSPISE